MAVQVQGEVETDGYGDSMEAFRTAHAENTKILLNLADGKTGRRKNDPRPAYNPAHPDNAWPQMVYHPEKGHLEVGASVAKLPEEMKGGQVKKNQNALDAALKGGYRKEPYLKPKVAVADAGTEKAEMIRKNLELQGQITAQNDALAKLQQTVDALAAAKKE